MALFENFPYTNFHELNLDWVIKKMNETVDTVREEKATIDETIEGLPELVEEEVRRVVTLLGMYYRPESEAIVFELIGGE